MVFPKLMLSLEYGYFFCLSQFTFESSMGLCSKSFSSFLLHLFTLLANQSLGFIVPCIGLRGVKKMACEVLQYTAYPYLVCEKPYISMRYSCYTWKCRSLSCSCIDMRMIAYNIIKSITTPVILPNALFHSSFISVYQSFQTILLVVKNSGLHHRCELKRSSSIHQRRNIPARKQQQLYRSIQLQSTIVDQ